MSNSHKSGSDWLIKTRLQPPYQRLDLVRRPALLGALANAVATVPLTLISAPAGYGKTTLASQLVAWRQQARQATGAANAQVGDPGRNNAERAYTAAVGDSAISPPAPHPQQGAGAALSAAETQLYPGLRFAWLALDSDDNDVARFVEALAAVLSGAGRDEEALIPVSLNGPNDAALQARRMVGHLINNLVATLDGPTVLALDDLHLITNPDVYAALDLLIARMPPQLHLLALTRTDPPLTLSRLRARGQLIELRLADLRFSAAETATFLNDRLRLELDQTEVALLQQRTEGWPAGLRLLAGSFNTPAGADRASLLRQLARSERFVFDFLADEVLRQQEPEVARVLLDTSILAELTPELCAAVSGQSDAPALLELLAERNLFLEAVEGSPHNYRYHALFADFLRRTLQQESPQRLAELHARAARAEPNVFQAIDHFLAAGLWTEAAKLIEQRGADLLERGWLNTLSAWFAVLPAAELADRPFLTYLKARSLWRQQTLAQAIVLMQEAVERLAAAGYATDSGTALAFLAAAALLRGDIPGAFKLNSAALEYPLLPPQKVQLLSDRCFMYGYMGRFEESASAADAAFRLVEEYRTPAVLAPYLALHPVGHGLLTGGWPRVERALALATAQLAGTDDPLRFSVDMQLACLELWHGRLQSSAAAADRALALEARVGGDPAQLMTLIMVRVQAALALSDLATAGLLRDAVLGQVAQLEFDQSGLALPLFVCARSYWQEGDNSNARGLYERMVAIANPAEVPGALAWRATLAGLLELEAGRYRQAEDEFRRACAEEARIISSSIVCTAWPYVAYSLLLQQRDEAAALLAQLLDQYRRDDSAGLLLRERTAAIPLLQMALANSVAPDYAQELLDQLLVEAAPPSAEAPEADGGALLSGRELEILRLVAGGARNAEIARKLVISENTLKSHLRHIFRKLKVSTRTQAAARAREQNLL